MKLSDYVIKFLEMQGVNSIFGYQGGAITHLVDSIYKNKNMKFVQNYHEQASAFSAEAYARITGNIGVATATSGPGATNLITGIGSAFFDSIPCLYLTGQVNTYEYKKNNNIRQHGFQETDIVAIVKPITKYAVMIEKAEDIKYYLEKVIYIAKAGRKGPVLLDIPMNIQWAEVEEEQLCSFYDSEEYKLEVQRRSLINMAEREKIDKVVQAIHSAKRPLILVGGGIRLSEATEALKEFVEKTQIPVVSSLMGLDAFVGDQKLFVGFLGAYGNRYSNFAVAKSDLILVLGSRLTSRQTGTDIKSFARNAKIIHIDIDENELNRTIQETISIHYNLKQFLIEMNSKLDNFNNSFEEWNGIIRDLKEKYPSYPTQKEINNIDPNEFMVTLSKIIDGEATICADVGQNQVWVAQSFGLKNNQRLLNSGGMGSMGFSLPAAIGSYYANKQAKIISICGDGGFQMNIQELQTIARDNIPIKIFIMNNKSLGMIRHFQEMYFESNYYGTIIDYSPPAFDKIAKAYGIEYFKISTLDQVSSIKEKIENNKAIIFEVDLKNITYVYPKLAVGKPIEDQEPLLDRDEFTYNMHL